MQAINDRMMRSHAGGSRCRFCSTYSRHAQQNRNMKVTQIGKNLTCGRTENASAPSVQGRLVRSEPSVPERLLMLPDPVLLPGQKRQETRGSRVDAPHRALADIHAPVNADHSHAAFDRHR